MKPKITLGPQLVAATGQGISKMTDIILSHKRLPYLNELCEAKGVVGEPVIFQTHEDVKARKISIVGAGATVHEKALRWILGEFALELLSKYCKSC